MKRIILVSILTIGWNASACSFSVPDAEQCYRATVQGSTITLDRAIQYCTRAVLSGELSQSDLAITYSNRGLAYSNKGLYDRAIADYDMAIKLNPKYAKAYNNRAWAYFK